MTGSGREPGRSERGGLGRGPRALDWLLADRTTGQWVVAQFPNPPLWIFLAARGLEWVAAPGGAAGTVLRWLGSAALAWWAGDEVLRGVNPFRRMLGGVVLAVVLVGLVA